MDLNNGDAKHVTLCYGVMCYCVVFNMEREKRAYMIHTGYVVMGTISLQVGILKSGYQLPFLFLFFLKRSK